MVGLHLPNPVHTNSLPEDFATALSRMVAFDFDWNNSDMIPLSHVD